MSDYISFEKIVGGIGLILLAVGYLLWSSRRWRKVEDDLEKARSALAEIEERQKQKTATDKTTDSKGQNKNQ